MKKIIDFKRCVTEKAEEIANWSNDYPKTDFSFRQEILYRTENGNYFIHSIGGPWSRYAEICGGNTLGFREKLVPFSPERTKQWLMETENYEELEELFPGAVEDA